MKSNIKKLAAEVVAKLKGANLKIACAESCTGGLLSAAITSIEGASEVLDMSVTTYSNQSKIDYSDVTNDVLNLHGAVSARTAMLMASGIRKRASADIGVGITGIAGPGGGTPDKPVGTVWISLEDFPSFSIKECRLDGDRDEIRNKAVKGALELILEHLQKAEQADINTGGLNDNDV